MLTRPRYERRRRCFRSSRRALVSVLAAGALTGGCDWGDDDGGEGRDDPAPGTARAGAKPPPAWLRAYRGPTNGPRAQPPAPVVFIAADLTSSGVAEVARGTQEAARVIGWPLQIVDGQGSVGSRRRAVRAALRSRPAGIILGGFDAGEQRTELRRAAGTPVVGWHAGVRPGPDRELGLFTNVTTDPVVAARVAARYAISDSGGTATAVIVTDSSSAFASEKGDVMAAEIRKCRRCDVLKTVDTPVAAAEASMPAIVDSLLERYGDRFRYLLAVNGGYVFGARAGLIGAGREGDQPPFSVAVGDGDGQEFSRIRARDYQRATVAEPLHLQGWQLIDEINRARARVPASGYLAPPRLITRADVPSGSVFDPPSGYRDNYRQIWAR